MIDLDLYTFPSVYTTLILSSFAILFTLACSYSAPNLRECSNIFWAKSGPLICGYPGKFSISAVF
jgi:hypothetical protein